MSPNPSDIRYRVDPGDVPADKAARRLHLTPARFAELLPDLLARGFPQADPTTGMYDLDAIDLWRRLRHPKLYGAAVPATEAAPAPDDRPSMGDRMVELLASRKTGRGKKK